MDRYLQRLLGAVAVVGLMAGTIDFSLAQDALPTEIQSALTDAAAQGGDPLLEAVDAAVRANPELAQEIVDQAILLDPALEEAILITAAAAGGAVEIVPAAGPLGLAPVLAGVGAAGAAGAGVAAAGGGGGGGAAAAAPETPPASTNPFETSEYNAQEGLALVNASDAYLRGLTGKGVIVAVLDTGLDATHPEFVGQIAAGGFDFVDNTSTMTDGFGHGTHVSGIIAASKDGVGMHGVAYDAKLLALKIFNDNGVFAITNAQLAAAFDRAVAKGAAVINNSWGTSVPISAVTRQQIKDLFFPTVVLNAIQRAVDNQTVIVFAAGNSAFIDPSIEAGLPFRFPEFEDLWVAVIAVDLSGAEPDFTNRCGVAAAWCIAAPGGGDAAGSGVFSTLPVDGSVLGADFGRLSGTSMAAPHVSGAVAVLLELFPELTPEEVLDRLFETADRSGIYANAAIFGNGLLDLETATRPVGTVVVLTGDSVSGPAFDLTASTARLGSAFGDGLQKALGGTRLAVFDEYNATFFVDLAPFVQSADSGLDFDRILQRFGKTMNRQTVEFGGGRLSYAMSSSGQPEFDVMAPGLESETVLEELSLTSRLGPGSEMTFGYNTHPALGFGLHRLGAVERSTLVSTDAFSAPYLSFAERGYNFATVTEMPGIGTLVVGSFFGEPEGADAATSFGTTAELAVAVSARINVSFQLGVLVEDETFLGSETEGAFDMTGGVPTYFGGVSGAIALTGKFDLVGSIYAGVSYPSAEPGSLFTGFSPIQTQSFSIGVVGNGVIEQGDRIGLVVNQPLRVTGGKAELALATGRDRAGNVFRETFSANLAADGREMDLEAFYGFALAESSTLTASAMLRSQPGHVKSADSEGVLLLRLEHAF